MIRMKMNSVGFALCGFDPISVWNEGSTNK